MGDAVAPLRLQPEPQHALRDCFATSQASPHGLLAASGHPRIPPPAKSPRLPGTSRGAGIAWGTMPGLRLFSHSGNLALLRCSMERLPTGFLISPARRLAQVADLVSGIPNSTTAPSSRTGVDWKALPPVSDFRR